MVLNIKERVLWLLRVGSLSTGQTLVEYSLILAFVATMVVALGYVVGGTGGLIDTIASRLDAALS
jgi:Flp pilus assembly pilin Flp